MLSYLKNRSQKVSIYSSFSTREEIIDRVPQESILGSLLFNISLKNILYQADDNVLYAFGYNPEEAKEVKQILLQDLRKLSEWFHENCKILNPEKCHCMCLRKDCLSYLLRFCGEVFVARKLETVVGIQIDNTQSTIAMVKVNNTNTRTRCRIS